MNALEVSFQNILVVMLRDGVSLCIKRKKRKAFLLSIHTQSHPAQMKAVILGVLNCVCFQCITQAVGLW